MPGVSEESEGYRSEVGRRRWVILALVMGLAIVVGGLFDILTQGAPLGFTIPVLDGPATVSRILYNTMVIVAAVYVGAVGLRELIVERRFSVEFLMSVAALGATYLGFLFEAATVLFLYAVAEYFEGYIEDRARRTVEQLSRFMPDKATVVAGGF